jgi:hypothetical protein
MPAAAAAPFIVGVPRSGTTLLRLMLDAHPEVAIPTETHFAPQLISACSERAVDRDGVVDLVTGHVRWPTFGLAPGDLRRRLPAGRAVGAGEALRAFYSAYAESQGKPRFGDKTPGYLREMRRLEKALPEAAFIHIVRDVRDVALSMTEAELTMPDTVEKAARRWERQIRKGRARAQRVATYMELRYEDLVLDTEATLRKVCDFIELGWDARMLDYHERAAERLEPLARERPRGGGRAPIPAWYAPSIHARAGEPPAAERAGRWRREMSAEDVETCEAVAGDLLADLGYELVRGAGVPAAARRTPTPDDG